MSKVEVELNDAGFREMLNSAEITNLCTELAQGVLNRAGDGYEMNVKHGAQRVKATVKCATPHAYYSNLKHNTLAKALGGGS